MPLFWTTRVILSADPSSKSSSSLSSSANCWNVSSISDCKSLICCSAATLFVCVCTFNASCISSSQHTWLCAPGCICSSRVWHFSCILTSLPWLFVTHSQASLALKVHIHMRICNEYIYTHKKNQQQQQLTTYKAINKSKQFTV